MKKFNQDMATEIPKCPNVDNTKFEEMRERILETVEQFQGYVCPTSHPLNCFIIT